MKLKFSRGSLPSNHHGTQRKGEAWDNKTLCGWTCRILKMECFRRLSTDTEAIQIYVGYRLWVYAPSGRCWHVDVLLVPTIKECEPYLTKVAERAREGE